MAFSPTPVAQSAAPSPIDPVQLHAQASNALSRCMRELRANDTSYQAALSHLDEAAGAMRTLSAIQLNQLH